MKPLRRAQAFRTLLEIGAKLELDPIYKLLNSLDYPICTLSPSPIFPIDVIRALILCLLPSIKSGKVTLFPIDVIRVLILCLLPRIESGEVTLAEAREHIMLQQEHYNANQLTSNDEKSKCTQLTAVVESLPPPQILNSTLSPPPTTQYSIV
jgi:hypothetical protein